MRVADELVLQVAERFLLQSELAQAA